MSTLTSIDDLRFGTAVPQTVVAEQPISDHALLEATRAGYEAAFAEIVSRYRNQITSYIYRMINDYDGAGRDRGTKKANPDQQCEYEGKVCNASQH